MRIVCVYTTLNSIFIRGRENARGMNAVDSNNSNVH